MKKINYSIVVVFILLAPFVKSQNVAWGSYTEEKSEYFVNPVAGDIMLGKDTKGIFIKRPHLNHPGVVNATFPNDYLIQNMISMEILFSPKSLP